MGAEPLGLTDAGFEHLGAEIGGGWAGRHLGDLGERDGGDLDVQVDAVEQGAGDAIQILLDLGRRAATRPARVGAIAARNRDHANCRRKSLWHKELVFERFTVSWLFITKSGNLL